jgi:hypothetical protein
MKKNIIKYLIEFLIVAFGVFLGSYANEKQNDKKINKNKAKAIEIIISELENNKEKLENAIEYHRSFKVYFDSIVLNIPKETYKELYITSKTFRYSKAKEWKGFGFANFESTAFETAKMSGTLQNMNIQLLQEISNIYNLIKYLEDHEKKITDRMYEGDYNVKVFDVIMNVSLIIGDNFILEKNLEKKLEESIKKIKTNAQHNYNQ